MRFIILVLLFSFIGAGAQVIKTETLCTGLLMPVGIQNSGIPGDDRLFVVEKRGRIKIVDRITGAVTPKPFLDIYNKVYPIASAGDERGLLGLAFHPDYANNGYFFVNYINPSGKTVISRFQVSAFPDTANPASEQVLMTVHQPYSNHNGGNLMFGPHDGYLYISLGDGGSGGDPGNRAQNVDSLLGKMLRIDVNHTVSPFYTSVPSNPFYGTTPGRDEIYATGLRNAWRCSFDRLTHDCWIADVGQNQYEEINFRSVCDSTYHNYGWRCYEGNQPYNTSGCQPQATYVSPVSEYQHTSGCSVTGGYVYRGAQEGGLFGKYLFTDYCQGHIWATTQDSAGAFTTAVLSQVTSQINGNFSSWGEDIDGELYLAAIAQGRVYRVKDTACAPVAFINVPDTLFTCGSQFTLNAIHGPQLGYDWSVTGNGNWNKVSGQGTSQLVVAPDSSALARVFVTVYNGTCSATSKTITVIAHTRIDSFAPVICDLDDPYNPRAWPPGGTFFGPGIVGNTFHPSLAGEGHKTFYYKYADTVSTCNYKASGCVLIDSCTTFVIGCYGIGENSAGALRVFPNPADETFSLSTDKISGTANLEITDLSGRLLMVRELSVTNIHSIPCGSLTPGVYLATLRCEDRNYRGKLVISR